MLSHKGIRRASEYEWVSEYEWLPLPCSQVTRDTLCVHTNKTELFKFLSHQVARLPIEEAKKIYATDGMDVLSTIV